MKVKGKILTADSFVSIQSDFIKLYRNGSPIDGQVFFIRKVKCTRKYKHAHEVLDSHIKRQQQSLVYFNDKIIGAVFNVDGVWQKFLCPLDFKTNKVCNIIR